MFSPEGFVEESIAALRNEVDDIAVIACSGGVDSTVAAVIANNAVGEKLHCVYVDTGFMRKNETEEIQEMLSVIGLKLTVVHAAERYFSALEGITEPEHKRKVIGELFIRIFEGTVVSKCKLRIEMPQMVVQSKGLIIISDI